MLAVGFMIIADLVTGVWRAVKAGEHISSSGFRRTVTKTAAYELAIVTAFVMEHFLLDGSLPVIKIVASLIAMTEGKSIMENLSEITGVNFMKVLMDKLQGSSIPDEIKQEIEDSNDKNQG